MGNFCSSIESRVRSTRSKLPSLMGRGQVHVGDAHWLGTSDGADHMGVRADAQGVVGGWAWSVELGKATGDPEIGSHDGNRVAGSCELSAQCSDFPGTAALVKEGIVALGGDVESALRLPQRNGRWHRIQFHASAIWVSRSERVGTQPSRLRARSAAPMRIAGSLGRRGATLAGMVHPHTRSAAAITSLTE
jgi:hypothetical protein